MCSVTQSCPTLCDPIDRNLPGSSIQGILQVRILQWVAISSPRYLPIPGIKPRSPTSHALTGGFCTAEPPGKPLVLIVQKPISSQQECFINIQKQPRAISCGQTTPSIVQEFFFISVKKGVLYPSVLTIHLSSMVGHIPLSGPPSAAWTLTTRVNGGRDSLISDVAQTAQGQAEWRSQPHRDERKKHGLGVQRGPGGLESWAWNLTPRLTLLTTGSW